MFAWSHGPVLAPNVEMRYGPPDDMWCSEGAAQQVPVSPTTTFFVAGRGTVSGHLNKGLRGRGHVPDPRCSTAVPWRSE